MTRTVILIVVVLAGMQANHALASNYVCAQFLSDIRETRSGNRDPEVVARARSVVDIIGNDDALFSKVMSDAKKYYGPGATHEELGRFGASVASGAVEECADNPMQTVKMALYRASTSLVENAKGADSGYRTEEFASDDSVVATFYMCVVLGEKEGFIEDSMNLLVAGRRIMKIDGEMSGDLLHDALAWYESAKGKYDFAAMWTGMCETPMDNIRSLAR